MNESYCQEEESMASLGVQKNSRFEPRRVAASRCFGGDVLCQRVVDGGYPSVLQRVSELLREGFLQLR